MRFLMVLLILLSSIPSFAETVKESPLQIWKVGDRRWTVEEEVRYGQWVEKNITEDFFIHHKIPVDCADVPYAVRWIYARIAHLPAAATTKQDKIIGHWSTEWGRLPTHSEWHKDQRFRKAFLHMLSETTTRTLPLDTYPISITPESVRPGTIFFITESHSGVIGKLILDGSSAHPLQTWEATVPAKIQKLSQKNFLSTRPESTIYSGLVKFRWPILKNGKWQYLPVKTHPFYSLEQYSSRFYEEQTDYVEAVAKRLDPTIYDPWEKVDRLLNNITTYLRTRIPIVISGYERCHQGGCPEGSALWEIYSTPGRDGMIILLMDHLQQVIESNDLDRDIMREKMEAILFPVARGLMINFYQLYQNFLWLSPHPEDSIEARWGLKKCEMILSQLRGAQKSIDFIEKTYRKRDPKYADFSIRQQQAIILRLVKEWNHSRCKFPPLKKKENEKKRNERRGYS